MSRESEEKERAGELGAEMHAFKRIEVRRCVASCGVPPSVDASMCFSG